MGHCCEQYAAQNKKKSVTLTFKRAELLYDLSNYSFIEGDILPQDQEHARHQVFDIVQDGNVDRVTRILNLSHSECVELLYPYAKEEISYAGEILHDVLQENKEYKIVLSLPATFSMTTVKLLEHLIHEFLVCSVLADWLSIPLPSSAAHWGEKVENLRTKIRTSLVSRTDRVRRKLKPF